MRKMRFSTKVSIEQMKELAFIMFFCNPLIIRFFSLIFSYLGLQMIARAIAILIIYLPVVLILLFAPKKIPWDFVILWSVIFLFILLTYLVHPEYDFWYRRNYYGVWDYVLRPDNGLYAYFFIRLLDNPKKIMYSLKKVAWIMYPYYGYLLLGAMARGYWETTGSRGQVIHLSYDLSFGYDVLLFTLVFLYWAMREKRMVDIVMSATGLGMIFLGGSRGPLLCTMIFLVLYFVIKIVESNKKMMICWFILGGGILIYKTYNYILQTIINLMNRFGLSSRTLTMLLKGSVADDNGRNKIWNAAIQMIKDNPFGYGALGTRHVIYNYHDVGHCHQIFLEILVDFGVLFGILLILFLIGNSIKIFISNKTIDWKPIFMIFFSRACQLLLSGTYWHVASFWGCIGIGASIYFSRSRKKGGVRIGKFKNK